MRDWKGALDWYRTHQTASQIGFIPDGMCLKICRTARDIPSKYPDAKTAQDATPQDHRVYKVADLRRGMVLYFDDPNDSNRWGHIVTMIGRVKNADVNSLDDILVETNSVVSGEVVVVRASYFPQHWGDSFKFGATWLNGYELDIPAARPPKPEPTGPDRVDNFRETRPNWDFKILDRAITNGRGDLKIYVKNVDNAVGDLPEDDKDTRVREVIETYKKTRVLKMPLLHDAVRAGRTGTVKLVRDHLNHLIKKILETS